MKITKWEEGVDMHFGKIPLQNGEYAIVDIEDYERCKNQVWYTVMGRSGVSVCSNVEGKVITLGSFILNISDSNEIVTRLVTEGFNFRRSNLKITLLEDRNHFHRGRRGSSSKYKGVSFERFSNKWKAQLVVGGVRVLSERFNSEEDAAHAYNNAVKKHLPKGAFLNDIGLDNNNTHVKNDAAKKSRPIRRNKNSSTGFRGAYPHNSRFQSSISVDGEQVHLGTFDTPEDAAKAYDKKAYELYGERAILNFPKDVEKTRN